MDTLRREYEERRKGEENVYGNEHDAKCVIHFELPTFKWTVIHEEKEDTLSATSVVTGPPRENSGGVISRDLWWDLAVFIDHEMNADKVVEDKYHKLTHSVLRGMVDRELKPNGAERKRIESVISKVDDGLSIDEKDLIWKFRYCLIENGRALTKFLISVDWAVEHEVEEVHDLLWRWAPIDVADALKLLGK